MSHNQCHSHDHCHSHGHGHQHDGCCSHGHEEACCHHHHDEDCCHGHHGHEQGDFAAELIELADQAWMDVLKCKIKEQINSHSGENLEELAKIVSEANHARWKSKLASKKGCDSFKNKIRDFFNR